MKRILGLAAALLILAGCTQAANTKEPKAPYSSAPESGADQEWADENISIPFEQLEPYINRAHAEMPQLLGASMPREARISYANTVDTSAMLHITWVDWDDTGFHGDSYSVVFQNVDVNRGAGDLMYASIMGKPAEERASSLVVAARNAFAEQDMPVPEDTKLSVQISIYDGRRSVFLYWIQDEESDEPTCLLYYAGYEEVNASFDEGNLVLLEKQTMKD